MRPVHAVLALLAAPALAGLPPLFSDAARTPVPARTVASRPAPTFLENLVVDADGALLVTDLERGDVLRVARDGTTKTFAHVDGKVAGIVATDDGFLLTGWAGGKTPTVWHLGRRGQTSVVVEPKGAVFLNGIDRLGGDTYVVADSYLGRLWAVDARARTAVPWLDSEQFRRVRPDDGTPGVNGVRVTRGAVLVTNTQAHTLLRIPVDARRRPGTPVVVATDVNLDDFAVAASGDVIAATHVYDSVVRVRPDGGVSVLAGEAEGVTGSTSVAFGRTADDRASVYVTTNGGMSNPPDGGVQAARVVRLDVGETAAPR